MGIAVRPWTEDDFPGIQRLSRAAGWPTPVERPDAALAAWRRSWPALVAAHGVEVVGFLRALSDGEVTTYVAELLVAPEWRGRGVGRVLLEACHALCPRTRLDLLSTAAAEPFYRARGFRPFPGFRRIAGQRPGVDPGR